MRGIDFSLVKLVPYIADDITKMMIWACTDTLDVTPGVKKCFSDNFGKKWKIP